MGDPFFQRYRVEDKVSLGREAEAVSYLESALQIARRIEDKAIEIEVLLNLATARQYDRGYEDFILHHQGRCYAEQGDHTAARRCFEQALELRRKIGKPRFIESTQQAFATLDELERKQ